jgi:hypothetical protein
MGGSIDDNVESRRIPARLPDLNDPSKETKEPPGRTTANFGFSFLEVVNRNDERDKSAGLHGQPWPCGGVIGFGGKHGVICAHRLEHGTHFLIGIRVE